MAVDKICIREHTTSDITIQLLADSVAIDLNDVYDVRLDIINSKNGVQRFSSLADTPAVVITDPDNGKITLSPPDDNTFVYQYSPYRLYVWVYETATKKYSVPEKGYAEISLEKEY